MNKVDLGFEDWNDQLMVRLRDSDTISNGVTRVSINCGLPRCKYLCHFFFVLLACVGVWLLFNSLLALLFSLFYVICEFDKFLHRG